MSVPIEFLAERVLPELKVLIARHLYSNGVPQHKIAEVLGVSQPAVSRYLSMDERKCLEEVRKWGVDLNDVMALVEEVSMYVLERKELKALEILNNTLLYWLSNLYFCNYHRSLAPSLPPVCTLCSTISVGFDDVVQRVESALHILASNPKVVRLVPEVRMNIVEARKDAGNYMQVVGTPGRITVVSNKLAWYGRPKYGGSRFLGRLIIEVMKIREEVRSVANVIALDEEVLRSCGFKHTTVGPSDSEPEIIKNVSQAFKNDVFDVVIDRGGVGIEGNSYVFGLNAIDVAKKVVKLAEAVDRRQLA